MLSNRKLLTICFVQYLLILGFHIAYSLINCSLDQTRKVAVWSVCVLVILLFFGQIFQSQIDLVVYVTIFSLLMTVSYVGYLLQTLAMSVVIFLMAGIILGMFLKKIYILVWWAFSTIVISLYVLIFPEIIQVMVNSLMLYWGYVVIYVIAGVNLYILTGAAQNSYNAIKKQYENKDKENELKDMFWNNISSEIRTPMNVINGMSELLKTETLSQRAREYTDQIENASGMLLGIVNDTLLLSNIETGLYSPEDNLYDIYKCVNNAVMTTSANLHNDEVNIVYCINPNVPNALQGDASFVENFMTKLLEYAILFTQSGEIRLDVDIENHHVYNEFAKLIIKVSDSSNGLEEKDKENLFQGFDKMNTGRSTEQEAVGLSLKLCKSMVEIMGGSISVESEIGSGTTFTVVLKQRIGSESDLRNIEIKDNFNQISQWIAPKANVLVVDDTPTNLKLISGMIKLYGIEPDMAMSGSQAIEMMKQKKYDLIFLDYMMPEMNGIDTLNDIKEHHNDDKFVNVPIIALTSRSLQRDRAKFIDAGFDEFISKPIDDKELESLLKKFLLNNTVS